MNFGPGGLPRAPTYTALILCAVTICIEGPTRARAEWQWTTYRLQKTICSPLSLTPCARIQVGGRRQNNVRV